MHSKIIVQISTFISVLSFFLVPNLLSAQVSGCTDPLSLNYNPVATINDGSCTYATNTVVPTNSFPLNALVPETSGLIYWNNRIFTHNDNDDTNLYALSPSDGSILETYSLPTITNTDWEAISQDENYIYIGDFGNNSHGNRTDLKIFRISKTSLLAGSPQINIIDFVYENQTDFSAHAPNETDFDCEAFIVTSNKIYLFTKQWQSNHSAIYSLPKTPGEQIANFEGTVNTSGLVTGATFLESKRLIALSGYTHLLQPFIYLLYDFQGENFMNGNKRKLNLNLPFHQIEGIATENGKDYFLSNEYFMLNNLEITQKFHQLNLNDYLGNYLDHLKTTQFEIPQSEISIFPNPSSTIITISSEINLEGSTYSIFNETGRLIKTGKLDSEQSANIAKLNAGLYFVKLEKNQQVLKLIKK